MLISEYQAKSHELALGKSFKAMLEIACIRHSIFATRTKQDAIEVLSPAAAGSFPTYEVRGLARLFPDGPYADSWLFEASHLLLHIKDSHEPNGEGEAYSAVPEGGATVQVLGSLRVAEGYVVDSLDDELQNHAEVAWNVRGILPFRVAAPGAIIRGEPCVNASEAQGSISGFLLDLELLRGC